MTVCICSASIGLYLEWVSLHAGSCFGRLALRLIPLASSKIIDAFEINDQLLHGINLYVCWFMETVKKGIMFYVFKKQMRQKMCNISAVLYPSSCCGA